MVGGNSGGARRNLVAVSWPTRLTEVIALNWQESLKQSCRNDDVARRVINAVEMLLENDADLFRVNAAERSIAHRLAVYVESEFHGWHVDCEYNRSGGAAKVIPPGSGNDDDEGSRVLPDIVVHRRGKRKNHLIFEIKKTSNPDPDDLDIEKLKAYCTHLRYAHAVFIRFVVNLSESRVDRAAFTPRVERAQFVYADGVQ